MSRTWGNLFDSSKIAQQEIEERKKYRLNVIQKLQFLYWPPYLRSDTVLPCKHASVCEYPLLCSETTKTREVEEIVEQYINENRIENEYGFKKCMHPMNK